MHCIKCHSPRTMKFIDGFGKPRVFCRTCQESILLQKMVAKQKRLFEFGEYYRRWEHEGISTNPSFITQ